MTTESITILKDQRKGGMKCLQSKSALDLLLQMFLFSGWPLFRTIKIVISQFFFYKIC